MHITYKTLDTYLPVTLNSIDWNPVGSPKQYNSISRANCSDMVERHREVRGGANERNHMISIAWQEQKGGRKNSKEKHIL